MKCFRISDVFNLTIRPYSMKVDFGIFFSRNDSRKLSANKARFAACLID